MDTVLVLLWILVLISLERVSCTDSLACKREEVHELMPRSVPGSQSKTWQATYLLYETDVIPALDKENQRIPKEQRRLVLLQVSQTSALQTLADRQLWLPWALQDVCWSLR